MEITAKQFKTFSDLVYHECGINLHEGKQQLLQARLSKRLRSTGIDSVGEYLKILARDKEERVCFLDAISTNHTYFFRESHHFATLNPDHRNIWCAASSSGEEPYSIAMHCLENGFRPTIFATDISTNVLRIGQNGIFPAERAKQVPMHMLRSYFKKGQGKWEGHVKVRDEVMKMVTFRRFNLVTDPIPAQEFDLIFCRNVLIYFDNAIKSQVINKLHQALKANGFLIIGGAESLNNIQHGYHYVSPSIYRKTG